MSQKEFFPFFQNQDLIYLDSGATAQKHKTVLESMNSAYVNASNVSRSSYPLAGKTFELVEESRSAVAKFLNADSKQIIFTYSATDSISFVCAGLQLKKDEKILVSALEHHSNYLPFINKYPKQVVIANIDKKGDVDFKDCQKQFKENKIKFVAITGMSNVIGRIQDIKKLTQIAHQNGAKILVDATQLVAHVKIDVKKIGCDFLVFSSHKIYGPFGVGVLYAKEPLANNYRIGGGTVSDITNGKVDYVQAPHIYEAGTQSIPEIIALCDAINYISKIKTGYSGTYIKYLYVELKKLGAVILGEPQLANISFYFKNISSYDIAFLLGQKKICVRAGNQCCAILHHSYNVSSTVRVSLGTYNDKRDCEIFLKELQNVLKVLGYGKVK